MPHCVSEGPPPRPPLPVRLVPEVRAERSVDRERLRAPTANPRLLHVGGGVVGEVRPAIHPTPTLGGMFSERLKLLFESNSRYVRAHGLEALFKYFQVLASTWSSTIEQVLGVLFLYNRYRLQDAQILSSSCRACRRCQRRT